MENLQWPLVVKSLPPGQPLDEVMPKSRSEILVSGKAFAPQGKPVADMSVRLCAAGIDKTLRVIGDRTWSTGLIPWLRVSDAKPFTAMPLDYSHAFGSDKHVGNLIGTGYRGKWLNALRSSNQGSLPNIEYAGTLVRTPWKRYQPAGFGPLAITWTPRRDKHGTYDQEWVTHDAPGFAKNVDWTLFNMAPADQWLNGHLQGGECYCLQGMHPAKIAIEGTLPTTKARAFVQRSGTTPDAAEEVAMQLDTIWFFPEHELGVAIYHGQTDIEDMDAQDIAAVMIAYEHAHAPKSAEHYRQTLALRLDPETALLHAFNESQLAPERSDEEIEQRLMRHQQAEAAALAKQQAILDEMTADFWVQSGMQPPPGYLPPKAEPQPLGALSEEEMAEGDFDMTDIMQRALAMGAQAKQLGESRLAELKQQKKDLPPAVAVVVDVAAQKKAAFERAAEVAHDLLPADAHAALPTQFADLMSALDDAGAEVTPAKREEIRHSLATLPALQRKSRLAAPIASAPAAPLAPEVAGWIGEQIHQWRRGGMCLAGRDFAGADLRGIDFSGADLRETMFEQADLSGARFNGANLHGAVLTGATLDGTDFSDADLRSANLCLSKGKGIRFTRANLSQVRAMEATWQHADLRHAVLDDLIALKIDLQDAILDRAHIHRAMLPEANADGSSWRHADIDKTILLKAGLQRADFSGATLVKAVLMDAALQDSNWHEAVLTGIYGGGKADWSGANLSSVKADGCGWHGATFVGANLRDGQFLRCDFGQCDLSEATLANGLFSRSLFMQSKLRSVRAQGADFFQALGRKADFSCADLRDTNLVQVELSGAIFTGALLTGVRLDPQRSVA
jgi:uncharacterized protein YjbI with pentapeptide repeats